MDGLKFETKPGFEDIAESTRLVSIKWEGVTYP